MSELDYVYTGMGSLNDRRFSNGNVYPITACPFGMANFTLQTDGGAGNWFYHPLSHSCEGIRLTHQPSPWVGDYGHILFFPYSGELPDRERWSSFRPEKTRIDPQSIDVYLQRFRLRARLAPTERGGILTLTRRDGEGTGLAILPFAPSEFRVNGKTVVGYTDSQSIWNFKRIREYFYLSLSREAESVRPLEQGGLALSFAGDVVISVATSFVSEEQAERNYRRELAGKTFDEVEREARDRWEGYLSRIAVSDENPERKKTFYSCFYRALLYPRVFHEYDGAGNPVHFNADTGKTEKGVFYTDNGFWDTYRTVYPFLSLVAPEIVRESVEGFVNYSEETGWLPKWLSPGEIGLMPGTLVEAVIADACVKGIVSGDLRKRAYRAMLRNAFEEGEGRHGRLGVKDYTQYGYLPCDYRESVNHTCDCAYGDFCIAQVAALEGDGKTERLLLARSGNWNNLFDRESRFLRGKDRAGKFRATFDPYEWGGDNCEGSSWQNSFAVYHDIAGLARAHGSAQALEERLDELFAAEPKFSVGAYGQEIHEMSEMAAADFGQCAISN
ncbi:MAG: GH92 family glycosyl hydrolase, partial [Candidatus Gallimonas sp.]